MDTRTVEVEKVTQALMSFCKRNYENKLTEEVIQGLFVMLNKFVFPESASGEESAHVSSNKKRQHGE